MEKLQVVGLPGLQRLLGEDLPAGPWHKLSFEDIQRFADATGDHQWIHVDRARIEKESPFGAPIAHGYYTVSRLAGLFFERFEFSGFGMLINYGLNKVRFPAPLKENAEYRLKVELTAVNEVKGGVEAIYKCAIEVKEQEKPACVAECVFRYLS